MNSRVKLIINCFFIITIIVIGAIFYWLSLMSYDVRLRMASHVGDNIKNINTTLVKIKISSNYIPYVLINGTSTRDPYGMSFHCFLYPWRHIVALRISRINIDLTSR